MHKLWVYVLLFSVTHFSHAQDSGAQTVVMTPDGGVKVHELLVALFSCYIIMSGLQYMYHASSIIGTVPSSKSVCGIGWSWATVWAALSHCGCWIIVRINLYTMDLHFIFTLPISFMICRVFLANQFVELLPYLKKYVQDSKHSFLEQFLSHVSLWISFKFK